MMEEVWGVTIEDEEGNFFTFEIEGTYDDARAWADQLEPLLKKTKNIETNVKLTSILF